MAAIGTGSTGIQVISKIAKTVESLTVFQRNPNWCAPLHNGPISKTEMDEVRQNYTKIFARCLKSPNGFIHRPLREMTPGVSAETRQSLWEDHCNTPGDGIWLGNYRDDDERGREQRALGFRRGKIRGRVKGQLVAKMLVPKDYGFGTKRVPLRLREKWTHDPSTHLGVQTTDFPNLLICVGPQSGSVAANFPRRIEDIVNWMTPFIEYLVNNSIDLHQTGRAR